MSSTTAVVLVVGILAGALTAVLLVLGVSAIRGWVEVKRLHSHQRLPAQRPGEEPSVLLRTSEGFEPPPSNMKIHHG